LFLAPILKKKNEQKLFFPGFFWGLLNCFCLPALTNKLTVSAVVLQMMLLLMVLLLVMLLLVEVLMMVRTGQLAAIVTRDDGTLIGRGRSGRATTTTTAAVMIIIIIITSGLDFERFGADGRQG
jgi:hypothetical protein